MGGGIGPGGEIPSGAGRVSVARVELESTFNQRELHDVPSLGFVSLVFVVYVEMCSESAFSRFDDHSCTCIVPSVRSTSAVMSSDALFHSISIIMFTRVILY